MAYGKIKADAIVYDNSGSDVEVSTADITSKAGTASPAFTGTPTAPTASVGTNTTQIATTAFVTANSLPLAGGTLTGDLVLSGDPDANLKAATKQYVDTQVGTAAQTTGSTFTGDVTFDEAISIERVKEKVSILGTAVTGAQQFNAKDQAVVFHNANASGNFSINITGDNSTLLNALMTTGQVFTGVFITKYGSTAYYPTTINVDGSTPSEIKWVGGAPSSAGTVNSITAISFSVIKTADSTFTVLVTQTAYEA